MAEAAYAWTPYRFGYNNPLKYSDPTGMLESTHIDEDGNVIEEYNDGDDGVYVHENGTTKEDVDQQREDNNSTGGDGEYIGELGGNIDLEKIMVNLLANLKEQAKELNIFEYKDKVKTGGDWDFKNNKNTIFGVAYQYDDDNQTETTFTFQKYTFFDGSDLGNFTAGYTGRYTYGGRGMPYTLLWYGAGAVQLKKDISKGRFKKAYGNFGRFGLAGPPYGDELDDYLYNTVGMIYADKEKERNK